MHTQNDGAFDYAVRQASYAYDGDGLLLSEMLHGKTTSLTWDTEAGLPVLLVSGATSYLYGPGDLPIEQITAKEPSPSTMIGVSGLLGGLLGTLGAGSLSTWAFPCAPGSYLTGGSILEGVDPLVLTSGEDGQGLTDDPIFSGSLPFVIRGFDVHHRVHLRTIIQGYGSRLKRTEKNVLPGTSPKRCRLTQVP